MATITKDTIVGDILDIAPETAPAFIDIGMHCLGCPASRNETVEQACLVQRDHRGKPEVKPKNGSGFRSRFFVEGRME